MHICRCQPFSCKAYPGTSQIYNLRSAGPKNKKPSYSTFGLQGRSGDRIEDWGGELKVVGGTFDGGNGFFVPPAPKNQRPHLRPSRPEDRRTLHPPSGGGEKAPLICFSDPPLSNLGPAVPRRALGRPLGIRMLDSTNSWTRLA